MTKASVAMFVPVGNPQGADSGPIYLGTYPWTARYHLSYILRGPAVVLSASLKVFIVIAPH